MSTTYTDDLVRELLLERFGAGIPWRERTNKPAPPPPPRPDQLTLARRRRALNDALEDAPQDYRRGRAA